MILACHASKARQALRATRLGVGWEAVVRLLPPRKDVGLGTVRLGDRQLRKLEVLVKVGTDSPAGTDFPRACSLGPNRYSDCVRGPVQIFRVRSEYLLVGELVLLSLSTLEWL